MVRMTAKQLGIRGPAENKYHAKRVGAFDSMAERDRHQYLMMKFHAGHITEPAHHPVIELEPGVTYEADFGYFDVNEGLVYEDVKGVEGSRFRLIKKIWVLHGPGVLRVVKRTRNGWKITKEIKGAC